MLMAGRTWITARHWFPSPIEDCELSPTCFLGGGGRKRPTTARVAMQTSCSGIKQLPKTGEATASISQL